MGRMGWSRMTVAALAVAGTLMAGAAGAAEEAADWEGIELAPGVSLGVLVEIEASLEKQGSGEAQRRVERVQVRLGVFFRPQVD